jgi:hypothetical protein
MGIHTLAVRSEVPIPSVVLAVGVGQAVIALVVGCPQSEGETCAIRGKVGATSQGIAVVEEAGVVALTQPLAPHQRRAVDHLARGDDLGPEGGI